MGRGGAREGGVGEVQAGGPAHHHESILGVWPLANKEVLAGMDDVRGIIQASKASPNQII